MEYKEWRFVDKSTWGEGPWMDEPDKIEWVDEETGYPCIARRNEHVGNWCGYVAVPEGHPYYDKEYSDIEVDVHGGVTYASRCWEGDTELGICHEGEEEVYWVGFDCAHLWDLSPGGRIKGLEDIYRDLEYVKNECRSLAKQLKEKEYASQEIVGG